MVANRDYNITHWERKVKGEFETVTVESKNSHATATPSLKKIKK